MFKKTIIFTGLLVTFVSQADVRIVAQLHVTRDLQTKQVNFDTMLPENDYYGFTRLYSEIGYKIDIRVLNVADAVVQVEFIIEDTDGKRISNPTCGLTWDMPALVTTSTKKCDKVIEEVALTVTASRS